LAPQWRGYLKSKTIIARGIVERFEGSKYVKESNQILERLVSRFQITGLSVTNLFKGGAYLNIVFTSAYFQVLCTALLFHMHAWMHPNGSWWADEALWRGDAAQELPFLWALAADPS